MIELAINDKNVSVEEGTTILQAAQQNSIHIPNMCYDKRLRPYGGCRLCVVEVEGSPRLFAACSTPAASGMVIKTDTPKLRKIRETILELLLVHHPLECPVCDKAGECDLQAMAYDYGKHEGRFLRHRKDMPSDVRGPLIELSAKRCILCGKCVRICAEHQGRGALGLIGRGFPTVVQPAFGEVLECDYCGQCVDICPTGALLSKTYRFALRPWFLEEKETICPFCGCGCTLSIGIREGMMLRSRGEEGKGRSEGNLCGRGRFGIDYVYSANRLKNPLIRKDDILVPATWDEAQSFLSKQLKSIINSGGEESVGAIGSPRCTNEDNYMLKKFMTSVLNSNNIDSSAAFGYAKAQEALEKAFGIKTHTINMKSPLGKEVIFIIESDISITHPVFGLTILQAKREGSQLIVADCRETKLTRHSSSALMMTQGTSVALLNGLMKIIIDRDLYNKVTISKINGFEAFKKSLADYTTDAVSKITGIPEDELVSTAETLAKAKSRMLSLTLSATENSKGTDTVRAASNLIILVGEDADSLQIPAEYANTYGSYHIGMRPDASGKKGKNLFDMLYEPGSLSALYIMGEDPVSKFPDNNRITETLKSLDLLVVQDIALTDTAKMAHVVLPASSWAEKKGSFTSTEGITQRLETVIDPVGQSLPDWQILATLSETLGTAVGEETLESLTEETDSALETERVPEEKSFHMVSYLPGEEPDNDYPFSLVIRDVLQHSGTMSTRSKSLDLVVPEPYLEMNEDDARTCKISDNAYVKITSRLGTIYLKVMISDDVQSGTVFAPQHFPHGRVNALTALSENGSARTIAVKIEEVSG